jgi:hypothetical protein
VSAQRLERGAHLGGEQVRPGWPGSRVVTSWTSQVLPSGSVKEQNDPLLVWSGSGPGWRASAGNGGPCQIALVRPAQKGALGPLVRGG